MSATAETVVLNANNWFFTADYELVVGELNEDAEHVFTHGHCHSLALAIHELTGWALVGAGWYELPDQYDDFGERVAEAGEYPEHVLVRCPDGDCLDVMGKHDPEALEDEWGEVRSLDTDLARSAMNGQYRDPEVEVARPFAQAVLEAYA